MQTSPGFEDHMASYMVQRCRWPMLLAPLLNEKVAQVYHIRKTMTPYERSWTSSPTGRTWPVDVADTALWSTTDQVAWRTPYQGGRSTDLCQRSDLWNDAQISSGSGKGQKSQDKLGEMADTYLHNRDQDADRPKKPDDGRGRDPNQPNTRSWKGYDSRRSWTDRERTIIRGGNLPRWATIWQHEEMERSWDGDLPQTKDRHGARRLSHGTSRS